MTGMVIYGQGVDKNLPRVCILLMRDGAGSRWPTIFSSEADRKIALAMGPVCLECAIQETLKLSRNWFIICENEDGADAINIVVFSAHSLIKSVVI